MLLNSSPAISHPSFRLKTFLLTDDDFQVSSRVSGKVWLLLQFTCWATGPSRGGYQLQEAIMRTVPGLQLTMPSLACFDVSWQALLPGCACLCVYQYRKGDQRRGRKIMMSCPWNSHDKVLSRLADDGGGSHSFCLASDLFADTRKQWPFQNCCAWMGQLCHNSAGDFFSL